MLFTFITIFHGFFTIIAQLIILRELPQFFYGNEIVMCISLTTWLFWSAIGSFFGNNITRKNNNRNSNYIIINTLLAFTLITTLLILKIMPSYLNKIFGEAWSISTIILVPTMITCPIGILSGLGLPLLSKFHKKTKLSSSINHAYTLEVFGISIGAIYHYFCGRIIFNNFQNTLLLIILSFSITIIFLIKTQNKKTSLFTIQIIFLIISLLVLLNSNKINLTLQDKESEKYYVEQINILGNDITQENVIRDALEVDEGDPFNELLHAKSLNNLICLSALL